MSHSSPQTLTVNSHALIKLSSGTFLFLPRPGTVNVCEPDGKDAKGAEPKPTQVTIKAYKRLRPTVATVNGQTLHVTLALDSFAKLRRELVRKALTGLKTTFTFDVDGDGDVNNLCIDGWNVSERRKR